MYVHNEIVIMYVTDSDVYLGVRTGIGKEGPATVIVTMPQDQKGYYTNDYNEN